LFQFFGGLPASPHGAELNGFVLIVLIYGTASISGGHLNPAVTLALGATSQITWKKMIVHWIAQFTGGLCGASWVYALNGGNTMQNIWKECDVTNTVGCNSCTLPMTLAGGTASPYFMDAGKVFGIEFLATFVLVFTVFATAVDPKGAGNAAPLAIGASLWACASGIGSLTGGGLNPARTLCPAVVFNCWEAHLPIGQTKDPVTGLLTGPVRTPDAKPTHQWAYLLAQLLAGLLAGLIYKYLFMNRPDDGNPGPHSVFKFMARDGVATRAKLAAEPQRESIEEEQYTGGGRIEIVDDVKGPPQMGSSTLTPSNITPLV
jgi:MIP family channel proteins